MSSSPYLHSPTSPVSVIFVFKCPFFSMASISNQSCWLQLCLQVSFFLHGSNRQPVLNLCLQVSSTPWLQSPTAVLLVSSFVMASISNYSPISFIFVSKCPLLFSQILYASDLYLIHLLNNITLHDPCKVVGMNCISVSVFDFQVAFPLWCQEVCLQLHHQHRHSLGSRQCILYQ